VHEGSPEIRIVCQCRSVDGRMAHNEDVSVALEIISAALADDWMGRGVNPDILPFFRRSPHLVIKVVHANIMHRILSVFRWPM
jgi:hypothetical protein